MADEPSDERLVHMIRELEPTGDECARIEQSATDGQVLASKAIVERLTESDAEALGLAPEKLAYRALVELPGANEEASRDAGTIAVVDLREARNQRVATSSREAGE